MLCIGEVVASAAEVNVVEVSAVVVNLVLGSADAVIVRIAKTELTVRKPWSRMAGYSYRPRCEFVVMLCSEDRMRWS